MFDWSLTPERLSAQSQALDKMALPPACEPACQSLRRPRHAAEGGCPLQAHGPHLYPHRAGMCSMHDAVTPTITIITKKVW